MSLFLYHSTTSVCVLKVRLALEEKGLPWDGRLLNLEAGEQLDPDYLRLNPNGLVPTLVDGGKVVIESSIIIAHLNDAYPDPPLMPNDPYAAAHARLWIKKTDDYFHPAAGTLTFAAAFRHIFLKFSPEQLQAHHDRIPDPARRAKQKALIEQGFRAPHAEQALRDWERCIGEMETVLQEGPYLAGDAYSLADTAVTPYVNRAEMLGMDVLWRHRPRVAAWLDRMKARPSFDKAITDWFTPNDVERFQTDPVEVQREVAKVLG